MRHASVQAHPEMVSLNIIHYLCREKANMVVMTLYPLHIHAHRGSMLLTASVSRVSTKVRE